MQRGPLLYAAVASYPLYSYGAAYGICEVRCERGCEAEGAGQQQRTRQTLSSTLLRARSTPRFFICLEVSK